MIETFLLVRIHTQKSLETTSLDYRLYCEPTFEKDVLKEPFYYSIAMKSHLFINGKLSGLCINAYWILKDHQDTNLDTLIKWLHPREIRVISYYYEQRKETQHPAKMSSDF